MKKYLLITLLFALTIAPFSVAYPYILPARHYLQEMSKKIERLHTIRAVLRTTYFKEGNRPITYREKLTIAVPGKVRLERWRRKKLEEIIVLRGNKQYLWSRASNKTVESRRHPLPQYDFFAVETRGFRYSSIRWLLQKLQIRFRGTRQWHRESDYREQLRVGLAWFGMGPAVILGGASAKSRTNQFWIDKEEYLPRRVIWSSGRKKFRFDLQFLDYHRIQGKAVFPGRIELYRIGRKKRLVSKSLVTDVKVRVRVSKELFYLK